MTTEAIPLNLLSKTEIYLRKKFLKFLSLLSKGDMHKQNDVKKKIRATDNECQRFRNLIRVCAAILNRCYFNKLRNLCKP
jgi:hypothetical protein